MQLATMITMNDRAMLGPSPRREPARERGMQYQAPPPARQSAASLRPMTAGTPFPLEGHLIALRGKPATLCFRGDHKVAKAASLWSPAHERLFEGRCSLPRNRSSRTLVRTRCWSHGPQYDAAIGRLCQLNPFFTASRIAFATRFPGRENEGVHRWGHWGAGEPSS